MALGGVLRLYGLGFGLPLISNFYIRPDESLIVQFALPFFARHGYPGFFAYPALLTEICALLFAFIPGEFAADPSRYFLVARAVSALSGIAAIAVVYKLACCVCSWPWALAAAAFFAVAPLPVREAHFGVTDSLVTLLVALSLWMAVRHAQSEWGGRGAWVLTALAFGLALSAKYTAALAAPAFLASVFAMRGADMRSAARRIALLAGAAAAVFVVLNPYVFLYVGESAGTIARMFEVFYGGAERLPESAWNWNTAAGQVLRPLAWAPGSWAGALFGLASVFYLRRSRSSAGIWVLALGVFPFLLALLPFRHPLPFRYVLPALPGLTVLAVYTASRLAKAARLRLPLVLLGVALFAWQSALAIALVRTLAREDTRSQAGRWIEANLPMDIPIVLLTPAEAEPQIRESAASIERRIAYVHRIYGEHSGEVVSELYRLLLAGADGGREVYRNPDPAEVPGRECLVVLSEYPMRTAGGSQTSRAVEFGQEYARVEFTPFEVPVERAVLDQSDAFYLPMNPWGEISRPGPRLVLLGVRKRALP